MRLSFTRVVPASPAVAWPFLAHPELMNRWSLARVRGLSPGDGGHPGGTGALRRVRVPLPGAAVDLDEVVVGSEPPHRLVYRAFHGALVRHHEGRIALERCAGGARVRWEVDVDLSVPGAEALARWFVAPRIAASLDRLAEVVRAPAARHRAPPRRDLDEADELPALLAASEAIAAEQRRLADGFAAAADDRQWFARAYQYVTEGQLAACRDGRFGHPAWVLRVVPGFHRYWAQSVLCDLAEAEEHWARARSARRRPWPPVPSAHPLRCLHLGMRAHIEDDLPRTLAEVWFAHYRGRCDYARFRADYLAMAPVFVDAAARLLDDLPPRLGGWRWRLLPAELLAFLMEREFYPITRERRNAFERGGRIARLMVSALDGARGRAAGATRSRRAASNGRASSPRLSASGRAAAGGSRSAGGVALANRTGRPAP